MSAWSNVELRDLLPAPFRLPESSRIFLANQSIRRGKGDRVFDDFTERARRAVGTAHHEAYRHATDYLGTEHLLLGLIHDGAITDTLRAVGLDPIAVRDEIELSIGPSRRVRPAHLPYTPLARKALEHSRTEAQLRGHDLVDAEHILWGLTVGSKSTAAKTLTALGVRPILIRRQLLLAGMSWRHSATTGSAIPNP